MTYIIENVHLLKGQAKSDTNLLVDGARIIAAKLSFKQYNYMRMDTDAYIMTPTHVLFDPGFPSAYSFKEKKDYYLKNFLLRGSTLLLTAYKVEYERELELVVKQARKDLIDSPIDYVLCISIPARLLTPAFIRKCKRARIPAIFVRILDIAELDRIPWGWVKEALFPYNSPIIPILPDSKNPRQKQNQVESWSKRMKREGVPAVLSDLPEQNPISRSVLKQIGIFPNKSNLHSGGELSYNLYRKNPETVLLDEDGLFAAQAGSLAVTVSKGKVIRAGNEVYYRPGKGENVIIKTPGFFTENYE
jgi:hypothetical protein